MPEDFGSYLKHERELRGIPLEEIAQTTKISIRYLRALEENRFEDLPGEVFIKGFIRAYGQTIGSNVDEILAVYLEATGKSQNSDTPESAEPDSPKALAESPSSPPIKALLGFGAALVIIIAGVYWITTPTGPSPEGEPQTRLVDPPGVDNSFPEAGEEAESTPPPEESAPGPAGETPQPASGQADTAESPATVRPEGAATETTEAQQPIKNTVTVPEKSDIMENLQDQSVSKLVEASAEGLPGDQALKLVIRVSENAWFNLTVDDQRDQDFIMPAGGSKTIDANNVIVMTIGNRRATQLTLNDQELELPESPDNVIRNLTVNAEQLN